MYAAQQQQQENTVLATFQPREGWEMIDAVQHPSGDTTVVLCDGCVMRLLRLDSTGAVLKKSDFRDPRDTTAISSRVLRGAVRLRAIGEAVTMVLRANSTAVMVYRLTFCLAKGYKKLWGSVVKPGMYRDALRA
jgi:hypothetical protein